MDIDTLTEAFLEKVRERELIIQKCKTDEERHKCYMETLDKFRCDLEPYIWQNLMLNYGAKLDEFWKTHQFPKKSKHAWVIVERRCHPNMWFLIRNIAWAAPHFSLYIFCSDENQQFIRSLLGDKVNNVNIISWFKGFVSREQGKDDYNTTFKLAGFYKQIDAEYMIGVQTDTYFRHKIPDYIFKGDYYGSPWCWATHMLGGGGITVRKIMAMIEICNKVKILDKEAEDSWTSSKVIEYNYSAPSFDFIKNIFSENFPIDDPIGIHQFWTYLYNFQIKAPEEFKKHLKKYLTIVF